MRESYPVFHKIYPLRNPSCIDGHFHACDGHTVVDYTIGIMKPSKRLSIEGIVGGGFLAVFCIISVCMEGFQPRILLGVAVIILFMLSSIAALKPHQSEQEALMKFMEDLEK